MPVQGSFVVVMSIPGCTSRYLGLYYSTPLAHFWGQPSVLVILLFTLGVEWFVRRREGML